MRLGKLKAKILRLLKASTEYLAKLHSLMFIYVQSYYRAFMQNKDVAEYPLFDPGL